MLNIFSSYYLMTSKYVPAIYRLPTLDVDDVYKDSTVLISTNMNQPLFSLGFHSFLHRTKSAMEITNKLETKNKFYYIVNSFENTINDYKEDISTVAAKYFSLKNDVISRSFFKMWEILLTFNLANQNSMTMVGLAEAPGSFAQAFIKYREKFYNINEDRVHIISINSDKKYIEMNKEFIATNKYPKLLNILKTSTTDTETSTTGDLSKVSTSNYVKKQIEKDKRYADFITADGETSRSINNNYSEQESYKLILGEIITALKIQAKNGSFVLKIFETFTYITIKLVYLLSSFYEETFIYKPFFSRDTNSEKYIICTKFKYDQIKDKDLDKKIKALEKTLTQMETNKYIIDIFPKFVLTSNYINVFKYTNILFANKMQIIINKLVLYIKSNNYFGDEYHTYRTNQIEASKWWLGTYFNDTKMIDKFDKIVKDTSNYNESELNLFINRLKN